MSRRRRGAILLLGAAALTGCAVPHSLADPPPSGVPAPSATESFGEPSGDDFLVIRSAGTELRVAPMTWDQNAGPVPSDRPSIRGDDLYVFVRPAAWTLSAMQFGGEPYECGERSLGPTQEELGGGWFRVGAIGPSGTYLLQIMTGSGPGLPPGGQVGAMEAYVTWETTTSRPLPAPAANMDFIAVEGEPGVVTLNLNSLATSPQEASAQVKVTGPSGKSLDVALADDPEVCDEAGAVALEADVSERDVAALGGYPVTYDITLSLDGVTHRARAVSNDVNGMAEPVFSPALS